jgi:peptidoglycan/LPS O-acetylase OafA/YrhL
LELASGHGHKDVVKLLLANDAKFNPKGNDAKFSLPPVIWAGLIVWAILMLVFFALCLIGRKRNYDKLNRPSFVKIFCVCLITSFFMTLLFFGFINTYTDAFVPSGWHKVIR